MSNVKFAKYGEYKCNLKTGSEISVERSIYGYAESLQEELETVLNSDYTKDLVQLQKDELKVFEELKSKLDDWQKVAEKIKVIQFAQEYNKACERVENLKTTNNEWVNEKEWRHDTFTISNKTYKMYIRIYEDSKYKDGKDIPYKWEVSYYLSLNAEKGKTIASIDRKSFTDKEKAYKYVEGRKKYFSGYFQELYQPISEEYVEAFKSCGKLIKNYKVEE